jgi:SET domain-containing protein
MEQTTKIDMIKEFKPIKKLQVKWVNDEIGWGVFTEELISKGEIIEVCYCLIDNGHTSPHLDHVFKLDHGSTDVYHVLGYGAIYNHNDNPNIAWRHLDREKQLIEFFAVRDVEIGEELRWNYGKGYWEEKNRRGKKQLI